MGEVPLTQPELDADLNHFDLLYPSISQSRERQYFNTDTFNESFNRNNCKSFRIIHLNIRSIQANGDDFVTYLSTLKTIFDVICFSETWMSDSSMLNPFPDYNGFHSCQGTN